MARRYRRQKSYASEAARRHIQEANQFSAEVGGVDKDVKQFFFSLSPSELRTLLNEYGIKYGESRRQYAENTYLDWKTGKRQMGGEIAQRLFSLLPQRMPLPLKYELVRKLWEHFCPKSHEVFYVGNGADTNVLHTRVSAHLEKVVQDYYISDPLAKRFEWLSGGDVGVRQQLQNYFQQLKRQLVAQALSERFSVIAANLNDSPEDHTVQTVKLGNHVIEIKRTHLADGVPATETVNNIREQKRKSEREAEQIKGYFGCFAVIVVLLVLMKACAK